MSFKDWSSYSATNKDLTTPGTYGIFCKNRQALLNTITISVVLVKILGLLSLVIIGYTFGEIFKKGLWTFEK